MKAISLAKESSVHVGSKITGYLVILISCLDYIEFPEMNSKRNIILVSRNF